MTRTTDSRQLRLLIEGVCKAHGVDDLALEMDLFNSVKRLLESDTPVRTREQILDGIRTALEKGQGNAEREQSCADLIESMTRIRPVTQEWKDFIKWAIKMEDENQQSLADFLKWWNSDQWQLAHPPVNPTSWYVKWGLAFTPPQEVYTGARKPFPL